MPSCLNLISIAGFRSGNGEPTQQDPAGGYFLRSLTFLACLLALLSRPAAAAAPRVQAVVDRNQIQISESIRLQVTINGAAGQVDISGISDFEIVSRGTNTSLQIVNGAASKSLIYNYQLLPRKKGRLKIPALPVRIDGSTHLTRPISVQVSGQPNRAADPANVIVKAGVSDGNPFQGQQILYTLTVYQAEKLTNVRLQKPSFEGFTVNPIEKQETGSTVIKGRHYRSIRLAYLLIPIDAGQKIIAPSVLRFDIVRRPRGAPRSPFDSFFDRDPLFGHGRLETRVLRTKEVTVTVSPLPPYTGKGEFSGLVGRFDISSELDLAELKTGESTTLTFTITGKGNIVDAVLPQIDLPRDFKIYRDNPEEDIRLGLDGFSGEKIYRIALVPVQPGHYTVAPVHWSYFDVTAGRYRDLTTEPLAVSVLPAEQTEAMVVFQAPSSKRPSLKKKVAFTGRDILPLKEDLDALNNQRQLSPSWFTGLLIFPALIFAAVIITLNLTRKREDPFSLMTERSRQAFKQAEMSLSDQQTYLSCLYRALSAAIFARAKKTGESLTYAEAESLLEQTELDPKQTENAVHLLRTIDSVRYGGSAPAAETAQVLLQQVRRVIRQLAK